MKQLEQARKFLAKAAGQAMKNVRRNRRVDASADQRRELQFAADGLWPAGNRENAGSRREFSCCQSRDSRADMNSPTRDSAFCTPVLPRVMPSTPYSGRKSRLRPRRRRLGQTRLQQPAPNTPTPAAGPPP